MTASKCVYTEHYALWNTYCTKTVVHSQLCLWGGVYALNATCSEYNQSTSSCSSTSGSSSGVGALTGAKLRHGTDIFTQILRSKGGQLASPCS